VHSKGFIHRDIKPDNFLMGLGKRGNQVYVIDFGLAKNYRDPKTHQHIPYKEQKNLTGTARYASINAHLGIEQSRRDDLESLGYVLLYFLRGSLPWQGLKAPTKKLKYEKISEKKIGTPVEQVCKGCPAEFAQYLNYCRAIHFEDKPDYAYLRKLFRDLFVKEGYKYDAMFDWTLLKMKENERQAIGGAGPVVNGVAALKEEDKTDKMMIDSTPLSGVNTRIQSSNTPISDNKKEDECGSEEDEDREKDKERNGEKRSTPTSSKLIERKSSSMRRDSFHSGSGEVTPKVSSSFIKLRRNKDDGSNGKGSDHSGKSPTGVRGFLTKTNILQKKGKEET